MDEALTRRRVLGFEACILKVLNNPERVGFDFN